jgi:hypothetical protein
MENMIKFSRFEYRNEYLKSDEWRAKSKYILGRDIDCKICDKERSCDTHHLTYKNLPFENLDEDLIGVCRKCHNKIHSSIFLAEISNLSKLKEKLKLFSKNFTINKGFVARLNNLNISLKKKASAILKVNLENFDSLIGVKISPTRHYQLGHLISQNKKSNFEPKSKFELYKFSPTHDGGGRKRFFTKY